MRQLDTPQGNFFEDFKVGQKFEHGVPRTITQADASLYVALTGSRFALHCAETLAQACGFNTTPLDNLLVFHIAFGKTVNDISLNAIANLGYAEVKFARPCFAGDTLSVSSEVIGCKQNSNGKSGVVYVRSRARNQFDQQVVSWVRWVMVRNQQTTVTDSAQIPELSEHLETQNLVLPDQLDFNHWQDSVSDNQRRFDDFEIGDSMRHPAGMTINDSDHSMATRLYQNNALVHFDQHQMASSQHQQRLVYGGHIISLCRTLSYEGLANAVWLAGINAGSHVAPCFSGDTVYCHSQVIDKKALAKRSDAGLLRLRMLGVKNSHLDNGEPLYQDHQGKRHYHPQVVLDLDYWVLMLR